MTKQVKKVTRKSSRIVESARIYITATFNNTLVTVTDDEGKTLTVSSCGMHGFSGTRKSTPYAGTVTTDAALKTATLDFGVKKLDVYIKGIGPGREASLRSIRASSVDVGRIIDITPVPHNGVRPPKVRRN